MNTWTAADVIARLRELATDGRAPSVRTWNSERGPDLPRYEWIGRAGLDWAQLIEAAGLEPPQRGGQPGNTNATMAQRVERFANLDAHVRQMFATAEPPRPESWPLCGIPTREEIKTGYLPDGTLVRVYRYYYSLR